MFKRLLCALLAVLITAALAACGAKDPAPADTSAVTAATEAAPETTALRDGVPDGLSFNDDTIHIMYRAAFIDEFSTEDSGDIVDQAVYARNLAVEERLKVKLDYLPNESTDWGGGYQGVILKSVLAGDQTYDIVSGPSFHIPTLILDHAMLPLNDVKYMSLDEPWWSQGLIETTSVAGKLFFVTGDISLGMLKYIHCIFANKALAETYKLGDLNQLVFDGKWTLDKLAELASLAYVDVNGDGVADLKDDRFGMIFTDKYLMRGLYDALEMSYFEVDSSGSPAFNFGYQRTFDAYDKLQTMLNGNNAIQYGSKTGTSGNDAVYSVFTSDRALFVTGRFVDAETAYREMDSDFMLLPFPKWDEAQKQYKVTICGSESIFGLPINVRNADQMGAVMEALAFESYKTVSPAYYERALKLKYSRESGDAASRMVDIIKEGAMFNPVVQMSKLLGNTTDKLFFECLIAGTPWASAIAEKSASMEKALADVIAKVEGEYK